MSAVRWEWVDIVGREYGAHDDGRGLLKGGSMKDVPS